mmetsp:Transcript_47083/g.73673  ORF Transcript_47083/g.73673 Transcript_47083/m.73673 type:complete len:108 (+) Transcript_47083:97-420(+)
MSEVWMATTGGDVAKAVSASRHLGGPQSRRLPIPPAVTTAEAPLVTGMEKQKKKVATIDPETYEASVRPPSPDPEAKPKMSEPLKQFAGPVPAPPGKVHAPYALYTS